VTDFTIGMAANWQANFSFNPAFPQAFHEDLGYQEQTSVCGVSPLVHVVMLPHAHPRTDHCHLHPYIPKERLNKKATFQQLNWSNDKN
jgi:hypothetical protein